MPSLKEVRSRIQSVTSTQQITKAMKMVAAAKLRRAQDAIMQMRPYSQKLSAVLSNVSGSVEGSVENQFAQQRPVNKLLLVLVTSDRGLCGAFNANVVKSAIALLAGEYAHVDRANVEILCVGKKGYELMSRRGFNCIPDFVGSFASLNFDTVRKAAEFAMGGFASGKYDKVVLIYNEFKNVATQIIREEQFLPIVETASNVDATAKAGSASVDYIFEPSVEYIINELIPTSLKIQFYKATLESNASENGARMTAMDKATENAGELLKQLKLTYNRTRQAAITKEILEIVGGAEALKAS
ncbi:F-type H+-transporting ATPase subunit gamma [Flexibacter flexilis DSM 6793]|uniref:ATP synthase gamma chain n=1 Tax=Flexibacter flexilis DSM 6793 TaxID=927664 RepID=A0A1I1GZR0_9BACT|nr:ATP synthase F1 subunit gamma [Flexibacter flexilis]SFC17144.1 F-type H+-transporting ATPase subunit gamma [Flexibacter flexilis DSM 6793]